MPGVQLSIYQVLSLRPRRSPRELILFGVCAKLESCYLVTCPRVIGEMEQWVVRVANHHTTEKILGL